MSMLRPPIKHRSERAPRFHVMLGVKANTFGSPFLFELETLNISSSGILAATPVQVIPFQKNTIVEMILDLNHDYLSDPIHCLGKVARINYFDSSDLSNQGLIQHNCNKAGQAFKKTVGIQITDISDDDLKTWQDFLTKIKSSKNSF